MTDKSRRFFSGDTLEAAVMKAARHHQLDAEMLAYQKVEKRHGFLRRRRGVVIEVDPEAPRLEPVGGEETTEEPAVEQPVVSAAREEEPAAVAAMTGAEDVAAVAGEPAGRRGSGEAELVELPQEPTPAAERFAPAEAEIAAATKEGLELLFEVADLDLESAVYEGEDQLEIELWGRDQEQLVADRGKLLLSIQHLIPRLLRGLSGRALPCRVDSDNFHEIRQERLRDLAQRSAAEVRRRGDSRTPGADGSGRAADCPLDAGRRHGGRDREPRRRLLQTDHHPPDPQAPPGLRPGLAGQHNLARHGAATSDYN